MTIHQYGDKFDSDRTDKQLSVHEGARRTGTEVVARRELAHCKGVTDAHASTHTIDLWFRNHTDTVNYMPPDGWEIRHVSFFNREEASVCIELARSGSWAMERTNPRGRYLGTVHRENGDYR